MRTGLAPLEANMLDEALLFDAAVGFTFFWIATVAALSISAFGRELLPIEAALRSGNSGNQPRQNL